MNQIAIMESKIEVLCKQVDDLNRELKLVNIAHAVEKDIMQTNFDQCKSAAEYWKKKYEEICKCKDCPFCGQRQCMRK
jgi:hypothetical protein